MFYLIKGELDTGDLRNHMTMALDHSSPNTYAASLEMTEIPHGMKWAANEAQSEDKWPKIACNGSTDVGIYWMVHH
jgi:hypothetical protein